MGNKEISNYLNSNNMKTPTGKDYTRQLIGMYFENLRKIERRLKHSKSKLTNIRFWTDFGLVIKKKPRRKCYLSLKEKT